MLTRLLLLSTFLLFTAQPASAGSLACLVGKVHQFLSAERPPTERVVQNFVVSDSTGRQKASPLSPVAVKPETAKPLFVDRRQRKLQQYEGQNRRKAADIASPAKVMNTLPSRDLATERYQQPTPGLVGDPYSPEEVQKRHEASAKQFGTAESVRPEVVRPIREFVGKNQTNLYHEWFRHLDPSLQRRVVARLERVMHGDGGDIRPLSGGVFELRLHFGAGYRIYFAQEGKTGMALLTAGEKSTQKKNIGDSLRLREELSETKSP